jgi:predicted neutral ceramidase superfamily lipid hydrolase
MPDEKKFLIHYSDYFRKNALTIKNSILLLLGLGILAGIIDVLVLQYQNILSGSFYIIANGASAGLLVVSLPALLSAALFKISIRRIHLKHILMALLISSLTYSFFIVINSIFFLFTKSYVVAYVILLLANASIFGYWFIVGRFLIGHRRSAVANGVIQPTLNALFYIPLGKYLLNIHMLLLPLLIKLYAGMLVFLIIGYIFFYIIDRPTRKLLNISGIKIFTVMVNQWLYNMGSLDINMGIGIKKDIAVEMLILKHNTDYKAVFVKPDIHYGPFAGTGGAITTEYLGNFIAKKYNAAPFILHGAINVIYNPISTSQIVGIAKIIEKKIADLKDTEFANARGSIGIGVDGPCKAIDMRINDSSIVTLTKAPKITEDIDHEVGIELSKVAGLNSIIVDAHNSRFENAS